MNITSRNDSKRRMIFVEGFIQTYNETETELQYEYRKKFEAKDIQRVQEIIRING